MLAYTYKDLGKGTEWANVTYERLPLEPNYAITLNVTNEQVLFYKFLLGCQLPTSRETPTKLLIHGLRQAIHSINLFNWNLHKKHMKRRYIVDEEMNNC